MKMGKKINKFNQNEERNKNNFHRFIHENKKRYVYRRKKNYDKLTRPKKAVLRCNISAKNVISKVPG